MPPRHCRLIATPRSTLGIDLHTTGQRSGNRLKAQRALARRNREPRFTPQAKLAYTQLGDARGDKQGAMICDV
jgi:hypothetical protein